MKSILSVLACFPLVFVLCGVAPAAGPGASLESVTFVPQWTAQAQFAGFYVAREKGFYRDNGLDVTILRGGAERPPAQWLRKGGADFCTMFLANAIQERAYGTRFVNIGQVIPRSTQALVARKSSGIRSWHDMNGRKVGLFADLSVLPMAVFRRYGIKPLIVPQISSVNLFLRGGVSVVSVLMHNEYHTLLSSGLDPEELTVFPLATGGRKFPEDGIYCLESTFKKDPGKCCRFAQASLAGWKYAFEHKEEALDIVMKYVGEANIATNRMHQKWMLERIRDVAGLPGEMEHWGRLDEDDYEIVAVELKLNGMIDSLPAYSDFRADCSIAYEK